MRKLRKEEFPRALLEIPQPPEELYIRGVLPDESRVFLTVVGSRKNTSYGKEVCERLIEALKDYPVVIVSGLALGIDSIAHRKAIDVGLPTMSFPGSGLLPEALYPSSNIKLAEIIEESGGCLISEFKPDMKSTQYSFPQRNRLMAGISKAILIIEAQEKSGTLITARLGLDYNRDILAVPGRIDWPTARGTNKLIRAGATPITGPEDLLEALGFEVKTSEEKQQKLFAECSEDEKKVLNILIEPKSRDELIRELSASWRMSTPTANALLSIMELKDLIKELGGYIQRNM